MSDVRDKALEPPEDKVICYCAECDGEIYQGQECLEVEGEIIHDHCFEDFARQKLEPKTKYAGEDF